MVKISAFFITYNIYVSNVGAHCKCSEDSYVVSMHFCGNPETCSKHIKKLCVLDIIMFRILEIQQIYANYPYVEHAQIHIGKTSMFRHV